MAYSKNSFKVFFLMKICQLSLHRGKKVPIILYVESMRCASVLHSVHCTVWMYTVKELPGTVSELASCSGVISPNGSAAYWITCCSHTGLTAPIGLKKAKCSVAKLPVNMLVNPEINYSNAWISSVLPDPSPFA